jgi:hypothetical protein
VEARRIFSRMNRPFILPSIGYTVKRIMYAARNGGSEDAPGKLEG